MTGIRRCLFPSTSTSVHPPRPAVMGHLPPELIDLIIDHLYDDMAALKACSLVSRAFLPRSQTLLFESLSIYGDWRIPVPLRAHSYTRNLAISIRNGCFIQPHHLDKILNVCVSFKSVRDLWLWLFPTQFIDTHFTLTSRYFAHFQPTLRCLELTAPTKNPKDLIAFVAFFPLLEEVSLKLFDFYTKSSSKFGELDPHLLNPLRGALWIDDNAPDSGFVQELAMVRVQYHTLELYTNPVSSVTGLQALITACAPNLRVLRMHRSTPFSACW